MHNQSINSLALISARYTALAVNLLQMIYANQLLVCCQAIDLRAMYSDFFRLMKVNISAKVKEHLHLCYDIKDFHENLSTILYAKAIESFTVTASLDTSERFAALVKPLISDVFTYISIADPLSYTFHVTAFQSSLADTLGASWTANRAAYFSKPPGAAESLLGNGTRLVYLWVRQTLGIQMRMGIDYDKEETDKQLSKIYRGIITGEVNDVLLSALRPQEEGGTGRA
ncbi:hypothetical protein M422DRAFT_71598 [Sphaerobolus stellatus SS14]|uniref:Uncharacterized protein n=1 Tax=Sphaerobolus stellatus (strain SS14) TaxID=990650 RepID=A0A0C9UQC3_SPHS4|nr:hypothetical protein M422DRAFT_71598 [Sphaerobolus stellatus SS14]